MFHFQTSEVMIGFERGYYDNYLNFIKMLNVAKVSWLCLDKFWDNRYGENIMIYQDGMFWNSWKGNIIQFF